MTEEDTQGVSSLCMHTHAHLWIHAHMCALTNTHTQNNLGNIARDINNQSN